VTPGLLVVKLGGRALEAKHASSELGRELATLGHPVVLVHGGGAEVTRWSERLGLVPRFDGGLRVTDQDTLEVAVAVLAGLANKRLVASLRAHGVDSVGMTPVDGGVVEILPHPDAARLGEVGRVGRVRTDLLREHLGAGRVPVLASIGAHEGRLLNVNADDLAAGLAGALAASTLVLLSDTPGVSLDGAIVARIDAGAIAQTLAHPDVSGGMRPKLAACAAAVEAGAARAVIAAWQGPGTLSALAAGAPSGTWVERASETVARGER